MKDSDIVNEWLKNKQIECYNVRTFKTINKNGVPVYDICLASAEEGAKSGITIDEEEFKGCIFKVNKVLIGGTNLACINFLFNINLLMRCYF